MADLPPPEWGNLAGRRHAAALGGLRSYEDAAVRRVLAKLGLGGLARRLVEEVGEVTGQPACTFAAMDRAINFPVKFGVGRIRGVKFIALPDLFDRWTTTALHANLAALAEEYPDDDQLCLVFRYSGDTDTPGPKGGRFMALHTFDSAPVIDTTRVVRIGRLRGRKAAITLETLDALLANFAGWRTG